MTIDPYLFFDGRCEEAIAFYRDAVGAEVRMIACFRDAPPGVAVPPGREDKVMHAHLTIGGSVVLMSDGCEGEARFAGFSLILNVADEMEAARAFAALSQGGDVRMALAPTSTRAASARSLTASASLDGDGAEPLRSQPSAATRVSALRPLAIVAARLLQ